MKCRGCGLVQRIGTADSAVPHPDPSGGQAPALHFLIPPSAVGLQFGTFRPWRAGIEVDWRAHPGSESVTCFRTNRPCRLVPAHQGMRMCPGRWRCLGVVGAALPLWIPAFARMTRWGGGRPARVCRAPPRASRESPLQCCWWLVGFQLAGRGLPSPLDSGFRRSDELVVGGMPAGITGPAGLGWGQAPALHFTVCQQQDAGDPAGGFGEVLDFVGLERPAEDGAFAVGEPLLEDLVAA